MIVGDKNITIDNSFSVAMKYIGCLNLDYVSDAFKWTDEEKWKSSCRGYLLEPHKGEAK